MPCLTLSPDGPLLGPDGLPFKVPHADAIQIEVPHPDACIVRLALPRGEVVKVPVNSRKG